MQIRVKTRKVKDLWNLEADIIIPFDPDNDSSSKLYMFSQDYLALKMLGFPQLINTEVLLVMQPSSVALTSYFGVSFCLI